MDITFMIEDIQFNVRVAAYIKNGNKILIEQRKDATSVGLPGGRVKIGENSIQALKREIKEEMQEELEFVASKAVIENFYESKYTNGLCHEVLFILEMEFKNKDAYLKNNIINMEDNGSVFKWMDIEEVKNNDFKPDIYKQYLDKEEFRHIINKD